MAKIELRPYQRRVVANIFAGWDAGLGRVAISAATGAGKSVVFGEVARRHLANHRAAGPVVLLAHRRELVTQAAGHFRRANPDLTVATVIGSPGRVGSQKHLRATYSWRQADVLVSTVQTLASPTTMRAFPNPSLVICDEAHHAPSQQWKKVLTGLGCYSGTRALGVTATPFREDHRDFSDAFEAIVAAIDISWLIGHRSNPESGAEESCPPGQGYLVPPRLRHLTVDGLDLSDVPTSRMSGAVDFREAELAEAMQAAGAFEMVAKTVVAELPERKGVIFAPTVASSKHLAATLSELGAPCHHVDGSMPTAERDQMITDFREDRVRWLSNVGIVSEGFDIPEIDTVVLARPTRSRIFFRQAVGRALRPAPGKDHAIVLDVAGASDGHSLAGVEALTDTDVLVAKSGESLTELLDRSNRARRGVVDRIKAHVEQAQERQDRGERAVEQLRVTAEQFEVQLPGISVFVDRAQPYLHQLLDRTTPVVDAASTSGTLDELGSVEQRCAELVKLSLEPLSNIEGLKTSLRAALLTLREEPQGEVARAMVTGYVGTVAGRLFDEEEARYKPGAPKEVKGLKVRAAGRVNKPTFEARNGWILRSTDGHLFAPVHGRRDVAALCVALRLGDNEFRCVSWDTRSGQADSLAMETLGEEDAYRLITNVASERDESPGNSLLNPNAPWRKKPAGDSQYAMARRISPQHSFPDREVLTAAYVSDVITHGRYNTPVNKLGVWVAEQLKESV